jgi:hypothetical protein
MPVMSVRGTARGWAKIYEIHAGLAHWRRIHIMTRLAARGPAMPMDLAPELGYDPGHLGIVLRGMRAGWLVESYPACRRLGDPEDGLRRDRRGHVGRVWHATEIGRWSLWRYAWMWRSLYYGPGGDPPLRGDVPLDPVEAVAAAVQQEFLGPGAMTIAERLMWLEPSSMRQVSLQARLETNIVRQRIRRWEALGWVAPEGEGDAFQGRRWPLWRFTRAGYVAMARHADALRKAGRACGWTPHPGCITYKGHWDAPEDPHCEVHYEEEFLARGWAL